ncbi:hypothetical protein [Streptomyces lasiicapitis]
MSGTGERDGGTAARWAPPDALSDALSEALSEARPDAPSDSPLGLWAEA